MGDVRGVFKMTENSAEKCTAAIMIKSLMLAGIVFLTGFFAMLLFSKWMPYPEGLRGFYYYRAATFGDGIMLPLMVFFWGCFIRLHGDIVSKWKVVRRIIVVVSAVVAIMIQASWLISNDTVLNWTIPEPHRFNAAGWWHAGFFVFMFALATWMIITVAAHMRELTVLGSLSRFLLGGGIAAGTAYVLIHNMDDYSNVMPHGWLCCLTVCILICIEIVLFRAYYGKRWEKLSTIALGNLIGLGMALLIFDYQWENFSFLAAGAALCMLLVWDGRYSGYLMTFSMIFSVLPLYGINSYIMYHASVAESIALAAFVIAVLLMSEVSCNGRVEYRVFMPALILIYMFIRKLPFYYQEQLLSVVGIFLNSVDVADFLFYICLLVGFKKVIRNLFERVKDREKMENENETTNMGSLDRYRFNIYAEITIELIAILCLIAQWISEKAISIYGADFVFPTPLIHFEIWRWRHYLIGTVIVCMALLLASVVGYRVRYVISLLMSIAIYACVCGFLLYALDKMGWKSDEMLVTANAPVIVLVIFIIFGVLGSSCLVGFGFIMNTVLLHGLKGRYSVRLLSFLLICGNILVQALNVKVLLLTFAIDAVLFSSLNTIVICILLPMVCERILRLPYVSEKDVAVVNITPLASIMQDGFSSVVSQLLLVGFPCVYISLFYSRDFSMWAFFLLFMFVGMAVPAFFLRNNVEHVREQESAKDGSVEKDEIWEILHDELKIQSWITVFMTLPHCLIFAIAESIGYIRRRKKRGGYKG